VEGGKGYEPGKSVEGEDMGWIVAEEMEGLIVIHALIARDSAKPSKVRCVVQHCGVGREEGPDQSHEDCRYKKDMNELAGTVRTGHQQEHEKGEAGIARQPIIGDVHHGKQSGLLVEPANVAEPIETQHRVPLGKLRIGERQSGCHS
jgi:hypothetical protein